MTPWAWIKGLIEGPGDTPDQAEKQAVHDQVQQVRETRERAETAIDQIRQKAEQTAAAYQSAADPATAIRRAQRHHREGFQP